MSGGELSYADLLAAARAEKPSNEARQRTLVALGLTASLAGSLAPTAAKKTALAWWLKLLGGSLTACGIGLLLWRGLAAPEVEPRAKQPEPVAQAPLVASAESAAIPIDSLPLIKPVAVIPAQPKPSARVPAPEDALAAEVRALDEVRQALRSGVPARAIELLDQYARDHGRPVLGNEAQVLRIEALMAAGRQDAARSMAADYLRRWPDSPFAPKLRALIGAQPVIPKRPE